MPPSSVLLLALASILAGCGTDDELPDDPDLDDRPIGRPDTDEPPPGPGPGHDTDSDDDDLDAGIESPCAGAPLVWWYAAAGGDPDDLTDALRGTPPPGPGDPPPTEPVNPDPWEPPTSGTLRYCPGTYHRPIRLTADHALRLAPFPGEDDPVILSLAPLTRTGSGALTVDGLHLEGGLGTAPFFADQTRWCVDLQSPSPGGEVRLNHTTLRRCGLRAEGTDRPALRITHTRFDGDAQALSAVAGAFTDLHLDDVEIREFQRTAMLLEAADTLSLLHSLLVGNRCLGATPGAAALHLAAPPDPWTVDLTGTTLEGNLCLARAGGLSVVTQSDDHELTFLGGRFDDNSGAAGASVDLPPGRFTFDGTAFVDHVSAEAVIRSRATRLVLSGGECTGNVACLDTPVDPTATTDPIPRELVLRDLRVADNTGNPVLSVDSAIAITLERATFDDDGTPLRYGARELLPAGGPLTASCPEPSDCDLPDGP